MSTMEVAGFEQAVEKIAWYTQRWGIEAYHRILKSGNWGPPSASRPAWWWT